MLWWLAGLWLASPVLVPFFWLLGCLRRDASTSEKTRDGPPRGGSHCAISAFTRIDRDIGASDDANQP